MLRACQAELRACQTLLDLTWSLSPQIPPQESRSFAPLKVPGSKECLSAIPMPGTGPSNSVDSHDHFITAGAHAEMGGSESTSFAPKGSTHQGSEPKKKLKKEYVPRTVIRQEFYPGDSSQGEEEVKSVPVL